MKNEISTILKVKDQDVRVIRIDEREYISLTDLARYANSDDPSFLIKNWLRKSNTINYIGLWEKIKKKILIWSNSTKLKMKQVKTLLNNILKNY